jgi:hypothetical protein
MGRLRIFRLGILRLSVTVGDKRFLASGSFPAVSIFSAHGELRRREEISRLAGGSVLWTRRSNNPQDYPTGQMESNVHSPRPRSSLIFHSTKEPRDRIFGSADLLSFSVWEVLAKMD